MSKKLLGDRCPPTRRRWKHRSSAKIARFLTRVGVFAPTHY